MSEPHRKHVIRALDENMRFDGRANDDYREIKIETDISGTAEGSAKVTIGDTVVIAGVKLSLEKPYPDTANKGNFMMNAELLPLSSNSFETGPPSIGAIELARVVDRSIRESGSINMEDLCVEPGEKVWMIICDVCSINNAGNIFDAASIAAVAALKHARFPTLDGDVIDYKKRTDKKLPMKDTPLAITVWKIGDKIIVDPLLAEQEVFDARLTVASRGDGSVCALQKGGTYPLTEEDVGIMVDIALKKAKQVRKQIEAAVKG
jgi:exosome complex component RRP42